MLRSPNNADRDFSASPSVKIAANIAELFRVSAAKSGRALRRSNRADEDRNAHSTSNEYTNEAATPSEVSLGRDRAIALPAASEESRHAVLHTLNPRHRMPAAGTGQYAGPRMPLLRRHHEARPDDPKTRSALGAVHFCLPLLRAGRLQRKVIGTRHETASLADSSIGQMKCRRNNDSPTNPKPSRRTPHLLAGHSRSPYPRSSLVPSVRRCSGSSRNGDHDV